MSRKFALALLLTVLLLAAVGASLPAAAQVAAGRDYQTLTQQLNDLFAHAASRVIPAVVNVSTTAIVPGRPPAIAEFFPLPPEILRQLSEPPQEVHSLGSGVVIGAEGYVVTNSHVIEGASQIQVGLPDDQTVPATVVGVDTATDLAVIKAAASGLAVARWGDSEKLRVGEWVLAIGSPHGLEHSVTAGIISAKGRTSTDISGYEDFLQTDAPINPGNSGGALVNLQGEVVGINTAIVSSTGGYEGIGFAIPSNTAARIVGLLLREGKVKRGYLGIVPAPITKRIARRLGLAGTQGVLVRAVYRGSPAAAAGLLPYDVIVSFAGKKIQGVPELARLVAEAPLGQEAEVGIVRRGKLQKIALTIQQRPAQLGGKVWFGL